MMSYLNSIVQKIEQYDTPHSTVNNRVIYMVNNQ